MPSGKRAKQIRREAASAPPPVRSKGAPRGARQASPRVVAIGGAILLLAVIAAVLGIVLTRGKSTNTQGNNGNVDGPTVGIVAGTPAVGNSKGSDALPGATDVANLFKGIPQNHFILGNPTAPVQLTEFIDLQCPVCQEFETTELPTLVRNYVRKGELSIKMEPWSILDRSPTEYDSDRGQKATIAAAAQNKAFTFAEVLYQNQGTEGTGWMNDSMISEIAASVDGLKTRQFASDANSAATKTIVNSVDSTANSLASANPAFNGTPSLLLAKLNGKAHYYGTGWGKAPMDSPSLESAINALLK